MIDGIITYLNTDLDLISSSDLTELAAAFESATMCVGHVTPGDNGLWYAMFEAWDEVNEPERHISIMLSVVESLAPELRHVWDSCSLREFNLGYDCGDEPWAFNQGMSAALIGRMAAVNASFRLTLYPDRETKT